MTQPHSTGIGGPGSNSATHTFDSNGIGGPGGPLGGNGNGFSSGIGGSGIRRFHSR